MLRRQAARFHETAPPGAAQPDGVITDALDEFRHDPCCGRVVAGYAERAAVQRARGPAFAFKCV
jgi:hypothetical protein